MNIPKTQSLGGLDISESILDLVNALVEKDEREGKEFLFESKGQYVARLSSNVEEGIRFYHQSQSAGLDRLLLELDDKHRLQLKERLKAASLIFQNHNAISQDLDYSAIMDCFNDLEQAVYIKVGAKYYVNKSYSEAKQIFLFLRTIFPENVYNYVFLTRILEKQEGVSAVEEIMKSLIPALSHPFYHCHAARIYLDNGQMALALDILGMAKTLRVAHAEKWRGMDELIDSLIVELEGLLGVELAGQQLTGV